MSNIKFAYMVRSRGGPLEEVLDKALGAQADYFPLPLSHEGHGMAAKVLGSMQDLKDENLKLKAELRRRDEIIAELGRKIGHAC